jgi:sec-independent protein translocase protein TatA
MSLFVLAGFIGPQEVIIIAIVVLLMFGGRKIPELMKGLGKGMKEFKKATKDEEEEKEGAEKDKSESEKIDN